MFLKTISNYSMVMGKDMWLLGKYVNFQRAGAWLKNWCKCFTFLNLSVVLNNTGPLHIGSSTQRANMYQGPKACLTQQWQTTFAKGLHQRQKWMGSKHQGRWWQTPSACTRAWVLAQTAAAAGSHCLTLFQSLLHLLSSPLLPLSPHSNERRWNQFQLCSRVTVL